MHPDEQAMRQSRQLPGRRGRDELSTLQELGFGLDGPGNSRFFDGALEELHRWNPLGLESLGEALRYQNDSIDFPASRIYLLFVPITRSSLVVTVFTMDEEENSIPTVRPVTVDTSSSATQKNTADATSANVTSSRQSITTTSKPQSQQSTESNDIVRFVCTE